MNIKIFAAASALALVASAASAAVIELDPLDTFPGNDVGGSSDLCEGGFDTCVSPPPIESPVIAKYDALGTWDDVNSLWTGLFDEDDFDITIDGTEVVWSYSGPIGISAVTVKNGAFFDYYDLDGDLFNDKTWLFDTLNGESQKDISHITFWDTDGPSEIPLPAAGWLLMAGVGGLATMRRRKKS